MDVVWGAESMIDNHPQSILVNETRSSVVDFDQKETWATPCDYPELGVGDKDLTWVRPAWTEQIISRDFIKESRVDSSSWRCLWICTVDRTFLDNGLQVDGGFFFFLKMLTGNSDGGLDSVPEKHLSSCQWQLFVSTAIRPPTVNLPFQMISDNFQSYLRLIATLYILQPNSD